MPRLKDITGSHLSACVSIVTPISKPILLVMLVGWLCVTDIVNGQSGQSIYLRLESLAKASLDLDCPHSRRESEDVRIRYRLFLPKPFDSKHSYPLIIWLHGWGDRGDDNVSHLMHMETTIYGEGDEHASPFFVLAPQCSRTPSRNWLTPLEARSPSNNVAESRDMLDVTLQLLDHVQQQYPIDKEKITVVGISSGGSACWELQYRQPQRFAAVVPLGAGAAQEKMFGSLLATPIWAFHALHDPDVPIEGVSKTIAALKARGAVAHLTTTNDHHHDCWTKAFGEHDLLNWILAQRRGDPNAHLPGHHPLRLQLALWLSEFKLHVFMATLLFGVALMCFRHFKKYPVRHSSCHIGKETSAHGFAGEDTRSVYSNVSQQQDPAKSHMKVPDFILSGEDIP